MAAQPITLVTGGAGHLGGNLVRALLARGQERVRCIIRSGSNNQALEGLGVELVEADLRDDAAVEAAVAGVDYVYHLAAFVSIRHGDRKNLFDVNIEGSKRLMQACLAAGVKRVVYCSSFGAVRNVAPAPCTEASTFSPYEETTDYEVSKGFAEGEVLRIAAQGLDVVVVNPSGIIGGHDYKPSLTGQSILEFAAGNIRAYPTGGFDFVHVDSVVDGCLAAMERGKTGERYLLTGEWVAMKTVFEWLAEFTGRPAPWLCVPGSVMIPFVRAKDWIERTFFPDVLPRFNENSIRLLNCGKWADHSKAERELGVVFKPTKDAFRDAVAWFIEVGAIKAPSGYTPPPGYSLPSKL
ncbi:nucleoside diphosphate sugar epimerase [Thecamonas trahens ATCC 50062]|uniref:Nucleoside diphosphate sugar epimerase n=1 Tax=Thecamonas trahens ATCC 50062 TaxID=461836 RepID=A0A0L0D6U6_THETB|nr:nucleoside diphosphate sugar epimerase [Thecamonas trahens ATCC 50062]KNC47033.1 nucleoside diphosphate sugar epimerase [Thecamonas trahens ATCC 50062]|eukprot:XP_013759813.1 nucleoside diphosphate sugar epimerase [Thecamonas trahens ATCC 50062]